ncbi:MAG: O-antigen ligase family protein [Rubrobacteraceae bacterium]
MSQDTLYRGDQEQPKNRRTGRALAAVKAFVLLALVAVTAYGVLRRGLYLDDLWLPFSVGIFFLLFITLFARGYYQNLSGWVWLLVSLLAALVLVKGLSMTWTASETLTIRELLRSAMYLSVFVLALGSLSSGRQVSPLVDAAVLISTAVAGYGIMQKINPLQYTSTTPDAARIGSTIGYANTVAMIAGMGMVLVLARMAEMRSPLGRGVYAVLLLLLGTALYFTFSRGGLISIGVGIVVLFVLGGNRLQTFVSLTLAAIPLGWLLYRIQDLEALFATEQASDAQLLADGSVFRTELLLAAAGAFLLQVVYALLARRYELVPEARRLLGAAALVSVLLVGGAGVYVAGEQLLADNFSESVTGRMQQPDNANERLTSVSSNSRSQYWQVAWDSWKENPLLGTGAGTFQIAWLEDRPGFGNVKQVHNLYLEQGTETGVLAFLAVAGFTGLLLVYTALAAWRSAPLGNRRVLLSGLVAALSVYLFSSILEWHWYIPASTLLFFILAGVAVKFAAHAQWTSSDDGVDPGAGK